MEPNRIAVIGTVLAAIAAFLTSVLGLFEDDLTKAIVAGVALICGTAVVIVWLIGWQRYEKKFEGGAHHETMDLHDADA